MNALSLSSQDFSVDIYSLMSDLQTEVGDNKDNRSKLGRTDQSK